ncbi:D,D-heptose 1,7-bisphosphate phosphatase [Anaerohalosphaera lusitana]|uniref:D,D-heptose 1,7-bisphosphate phosphatase n=1 Tax=Anaerohalosphaera lusitana TaxID=1936003 RepID=A0A1U9NMX0_9BACT|nr:HAD-IIIA family hydrolase [Anaerohalosphaera lusitana]AQT68950.1 D,D-heptose 1,7-bisphosphate phosphatase [Anaerohalosphaera lusitana]
MGQKAVFLDRDDTIVNDPGYMNHPDQVELLPGAGEALVQLRQMGYRIVIITNQSGVARGLVTEEVLQEIHHRLRELLAKENAYVDGIYYCPYHPEGVIDHYRKESDLRKPNPGMLQHAAKDLDIDLSRSWMVGDSFRDIAAGKSVGCKTILINSPAKRKIPGPDDVLPDREAVNIKEAANIIRMVDAHGQKSRPETKPQTAERSQNTQQQESTTKTQKTQQQTGTRSQPVTPLRTAKPKQTESAQQDTAPKTQKSEETKVQRPKEDESVTKMFEEIVSLLKKDGRSDLYDEFSILKVVAGIAQGLVLFCLLVSLWFLMDSTKSGQAVQTAVLYGMVFQLMAISFFMMSGRK